MKPVEFPESNTVFAKNQKPYIPLPAWVQPVGAAYRVTSRWSLSWRERFAVFFGGHFYISMLTGGNPQPVRPWVLEDK